MVRSGFMLYGAYGYTGALIARAAVRRGHRPVLAGRNREKLAALAAELDLPYVALDLESGGTLRRELEQVQTVLHVAGPFVHTSHPMVAACLDTGTNYLDITGELPVLSHVFERHEEAVRRGVALIPAVGFDVVPSDCLAAFVAAAVPGAQRLELAIAVLGRASAGTVKASIEAVGRGNFMRRGGELVRIPFGEGVHDVLFFDQERTVLPVPWGDLVTAHRSTGIPNITASLAVPPALAHLLRAGQAPLSRITPALTDLLLSSRSLHGALSAAVGALIKGPDERARERGSAQLWARASANDGSEKEAWLEVTDGYAFTAESAVLCVERVAGLELRGALTPSQAFGADFVLEVSGTQRHEHLHAPERTEPPSARASAQRI